ncbi:hypothetical protein GCM10010994_33510 [Chelatococcus reniformis]|uniref:Uncharacterized protein n=1 Tax=Chelatococcus reniformis TaxID=1494448 RepID=A0A916UGU9_9HYPH|nr:hypothetical protein GCM10010994_33510 [Chelatococcus reniformis]
MYPAWRHTMATSDRPKVGRMGSPAIKPIPTPTAATMAVAARRAGARNRSPIAAPSKPASPHTPLTAALRRRGADPAAA